MAFTVQVLNIGLLVGGGLCALGLVVQLIRSGRWRNPLAGTEIPHAGPSAAGVAVVLVAFVALQFAALMALGHEQQPGSQATPGSDHWHRSHAADAVTGILISLLMIVMLMASRPSSPARRGGTGVLASSAAGVLGFLILLPIAALQSEMGRIIWNWLHPDAAPPIHVVLRALGGSEWGVWGTVQLLVGAVVIAPITEELFFRGVLLQAICYHSRRAWLAIALSGVAFGLVHAQPQDVLPLATMGVVLGYLRLRCASLWPCLVLHVLFNARTMTFVLAAPELLTEP